jgi:hypothetical protein
VIAAGADGVAATSRIGILRGVIFRLVISQVVISQAAIPTIAIRRGVVKAHRRKLHHPSRAPPNLRVPANPVE